MGGGQPQPPDNRRIRLADKCGNVRARSRLFLYQRPYRLHILPQGRSLGRGPQPNAEGLLGCFRSLGSVLSRFGPYTHCRWTKTSSQVARAEHIVEQFEFDPSFETSMKICFLNGPNRIVPGLNLSRHLAIAVQGSGHRGSTSLGQELARRASKSHQDTKGCLEVRSRAGLH